LSAGNVVGWSDVWNGVKASALRRLGKQLLVLYALMHFS
jgi:hypothetical protein